MRILQTLFYEDGYMPCHYLKRAFESLGHEVFTVGPSRSGRQDITEPDMAVWTDESPNRQLQFSYYDAKKIVAKHGIFDVIVQVEPGILLYNLDEISIPTCYWSPDDYLTGSSPWLEKIGGKRYLEQLKVYFHGKYGEVCGLKTMGVSNVEFLPYGVDPIIYKPVETEKLHDIVFIGHMEPKYYHWRQVLLDLLASKYDVWVGHAWFVEYCLKYSQGKFGFDWQLIGEIGRRFFEVMAIGTCLLTNLVHGQEILGFSHGEHLLNYTFYNVEHLVKDYIDAVDAREQIARAGREKVLAEHTYVHRAKTILKEVLR